MRIGVNTRLLLKGRMDGIGWFATESFRRIVCDHPEHQFYFFFDRKPDPSFFFAHNVTPITLCPQARHPVLWRMFFDWALPHAIRRHKIDLFVSPDGMMPLHPQVPTLTVIHDLNFEHAPANLKPSHQRYMTRYFPLYAQRATRIATVSNFSRHDIAQTYAVDEAKIDVVYNGSHTYYQPLSEHDQQASRELYTSGSRYLLFVSTILRRKNLANLLKAFDIVKTHTEGKEFKLVVVGQKAWWADELEEAYNQMRHRDDVLLMGRAEPEALSRLMASAEMLVYPSYFEGFGIPLVEAMYAETAVVSSKATSLPEVGGDAALYVDPADPQDIACGILRALDPGTRATLIANGRRQRQLFSWDNTAKLLWESMMKTIGER